MSLRQTQPGEFESYHQQSGRRYAVRMNVRPRTEEGEPDVELALDVSSRRNMESTWLYQRCNLRLTRQEARALALALCPELDDKSGYELAYEDQPVKRSTGQRDPGAWDGAPE